MTVDGRAPGFQAAPLFPACCRGGAALPGAFNPLAGPVTRHLFPSFFNCTPAETDVGTRLAGPARCGDLFVRARRAGCHRSGRATAAVRWPRCASLLRYARFARRILCPAGFLVALVFSRSKNASSNSSLVSGHRPRAALRSGMEVYILSLSFGIACLIS